MAKYSVFGNNDGRHNVRLCKKKKDNQGKHIEDYIVLTKTTTNDGVSWIVATRNKGSPRPKKL